MEYVKKSGLNIELGDKKKLNNIETVSAAKLNEYNLPDSVDWRTKGVVNPVRNQLNCGSCWAFANVAAIESASAIATGNLQSLSEQNLVDCALGRDGCQGGGTAFDYVARNGGIALNDLYPYTSGTTSTWNGQCFYNSSLAAPNVTVSGWVNLPWGNGNEIDLQHAIAMHGPVWISLPVTKGWQFYSGGTFTDPYCGNATVNHGVVVVGYGVDSDGVQNYIVRNHWGPDWGTLLLLSEYLILILILSPPSPTLSTSSSTLFPPYSSIFMIFW